MPATLPKRDSSSLADSKHAVAVSILGLLGWAAAAHAACTLTETDNRLTLENQHVRLVLMPAHGGKGSSLVLKDRNVELTSWPNYGLLEDRRWGPRFYERLRDYPYEVKVLQRGPQEVSVALVTRCQEPGFAQLTVEKTVTLREGEAAVQVEYRWHNGARVALPLGWWFFQHLGVKGQQNTYFAPTPLGVERSVHVPGEGQTSESLGLTADRFLYDTPRGWSAVIGQGGAGAVATFDVRYTCFTYNFANRREATLEWAFNQVDIEPGGTFATTFHLLPIVDLPTVDGAGDLLVGSLTTPGRDGAWCKPAEFAAGEQVPIRVVLLGAKSETVERRVETRAWPDGDWKPIDVRQVCLAPAKPVTIDLRYQPSWRATTVLRCVVSRAGSPVFDMERPIAYGGATGQYALRPTVQKIGKELAAHRPTKKPDTPRQTTVILPDDFQPSREVVTPHVRWATPWAAGKLRVLAPMHHQILRQLVELAQRTDIEYETVAMETYTGKISAAEVHLLTEKLGVAKYDVLSLADYDWNRLAEGIQAKILAQVEQGKGLVLYGGGAKLPAAQAIRDPFVAAGVLDTFGPAQVRLLHHGKGRIAVGPWRAVYRGGLLAPSPFFHANYLKLTHDKYSRWFDGVEYGYALTARLMLWAGGRTPAVTIGVEAPALAAGTAGQTVKIELAGQDEPVSGTLEMTLTDRWSTVAARLSRPVAPAGPTQTVSFDLPPLEAGPLVCDVWLRRPDGVVVNWATKTLEVNGPVSVSAVTMDRDLHADGDTARAAVSLTLSEAGAGPLGLSWRLSDCFGRLVAQGQQPVALRGQAAAEIGVPIRRPLARYYLLHVQASRDGAPLAAARVGFAVQPLGEPRSFRFMAYGGYNPLYRDMFGCNTLFGSGLRGLAATEQGNDLVAWQDIHRDFRIQDAGPERVRAGCLSNPKFREECKKNIEAYAQYARLQGSLGCLVADEWGYGGEGNRESNYCHSPTCLAGLRRFLQQEYGTLDALNRSWRTSYRDWGEIVPPTLAETQKSGQWEQWTDHRRWVETLVADFFGYCESEARRTYPGSRFGFSGTPNAGSFNGYDWAKLTKTMHIIFAYSGPQGEILRSFKQPDTFTTRWAGYDRASQNEKTHRAAPWFGLFHDMDGLGYFCTASYAPLHYPDWAWTPKARWLADEWRDLRRGIATLVRNAARQHDGIAIHYSQSSIHGATRDGRYEQYNNILSSLCQLLEDLGLQYNFVGYDAIERGELRGTAIVDGQSAAIRQQFSTERQLALAAARPPYRVLVMPYSQAVSPREAEQIAQFVRDGGAVIADIYPAVRDQHGHDLPRGLLDEVFGVRSSVADAPSFQLTPIEGPGVPADLQLPAGCAKLQLAGGTVQARLPELANAPAWITHREGSGQAVLLNFCFAGYAGYRPGGVGGEIAVVEQAKQAVRLAASGLGRAVLAGLAVEPRIQITRPDGRPYLDGEIVRYGQGPATYVGILPGGGAAGMITKDDTEPVTIRFDQEFHVYELRSRKYLGRVREAVTTLTRSVAQVYALLPAESAPLEAEVAGPVSRAEGARLVLRTKDQGADRVAHLTVLNPAGKAIWLYQRDVILRGGRGDWTIPLALDDPSGTWKIEAHDAVTGKAAAATFSLP